MEDNHIQYIEFQSKDFKRTKEFYSNVFGWTFTDYGESYISFDNAGVDGGFQKTENVTSGGTLAVLYHTKLELAKKNIVKGGGVITKDIFSFPGGRRLHFTDPSGNELAVWSDK